MLATAKLLSIISYACSVILAAVLGRRLGLARRWALWCGLATLLAFMLFRVTLWAVTDIAFCLLVICFLVGAVSYIESFRMRLLVMLAVIAEAAFLLRYMGITVMAVGFLVILILPREMAWKVRLKRAWLYGIIAAPLPLVWLAHNLVVTSTLAGQRYSFGDTLFRHIKLSVIAFASWFVPIRVLVGWQLLLLGALVGTGVYLWYKGQTLKNIRQGAVSLPILIIICFIFVYWVTLLSAWQFTSALFEDYQRYLLPVFVPALCLIGWILHKLTQYLKRCGRGGRWVSVLLALAAYVWLVYPGYKDYEYAKALSADGGGGYTARHWRDSQTLQELASINSHSIISNAPAAVYFYSGRTARSVPYQWDPDSIPCPNASAHDTTLLVWFAPGVHWSVENRRKNAMITPRIYNKACGIVPVVETDDGTIYLFVNADQTADRHDK